MVGTCRNSLPTMGMLTPPFAPSRGVPCQVLGQGRFALHIVFTSPSFHEPSLGHKDSKILPSWWAMRREPVISFLMNNPAKGTESPIASWNITRTTDQQFPSSKFIHLPTFLFRSLGCRKKRRTMCSSSRVV